VVVHHEFTKISLNAQVLHLDYSFAVFLSEKVWSEHQGNVLIVHFVLVVEEYDGLHENYDTA
jgi:hypothetical protein